MSSEYDEAAANYAEKIADHATNAYYERPATLSLLPEVGGKRVLDKGKFPEIYENLAAKPRFLFVRACKLLNG